MTRQEVAPGDVVLFRYGRCFSHGGIVTMREPFTMIHAFASARIVLEEQVSRNATIARRLPEVDRWLAANPG